MPAPYLEWFDENQRLCRKPLEDKLFLGRSCLGVPPEKSIRIQHPSVSRDHAVIQMTYDGIIITDQSTNGTWINRVRMAPGASRHLKNGDSIQIGGLSIHLHCPGESLQATEANWNEPTTVRPAAVTVTNLVADVRDFTSMTQRGRSHEAYAVMDEIITAFSEVTTAMQGTVKDYAGDAVFAFWEHDPGPSSQRAIMACQAAIQQLARLEQIRERLGERANSMANLRVGWGLTTGSATLAHYGSRAADLALVGDCINLAFRFSSLADKDIGHKIILCAQTAELVSRDFHLIDLGWVKTKGRTGEEHVYSIA
jgi:adenylate cyclase